MTIISRRRLLSFAAIIALALAQVGIASAMTITHNLNVEIIQVRDDAGGNPTALDATNNPDHGYVYESQVNEIWNQAGIQVTFSYTTWDNTAAQRLTSSERTAIYGNTFSAGTGDALPALGTDTVQIFFVMDHPGTGYNGTAGTGWVDNPLTNPSTSARNAGNAQLFISGTFGSNGRSVMANEGFESDSLSGTIAHEIGHLLGLRHVEDVNDGDGAGTIQDPDYSPVANSTPHLMWGGTNGPSYNGSLNNDPNLSVLQENFFLNSAQIDAAIYNGTRLDPDNNSIGVLQVVPEPSTYALAMAGMLALALVGWRSRSGRKRNITAAG